MSSATSFYVIGDLQGCLESLQALLAQLPSQTPLLFAGDIVNRGPDSLGTLRAVKALGERADLVLGNHDLHLLAVAAGVSKAHKKDTIQPILDAPDSQELIDWLRHKPLMIERDGVCLVHAGIHPQWTLGQARSYAREAEKMLADEHWKAHLAKMYGPLDWNPSLKGPERVQAILNAFTRMRFVHRDTGQLNFDFKEGLDSVPPEWIPWFEYAHRKTKHIPICFGHWSMLGLINTPDLVCTDTGCLWGGSLTAVGFPSREVVSLPCPCWADPLAFSKKKNKNKGKATH